MSGSSTTNTTVPSFGPSASSSPTSPSVSGLNAAFAAVGGVGASGSDQAATDEQELGLPAGGKGAAFLAQVIIPFGASSGFMGIGPFGIGGPPIQGTGANGGVTVQDLFDWIMKLPPDEMTQVQSDLANAGYYGKLDSQAAEPTWGNFGTQDRGAVLSFFQDLVDNSSSATPQSVQSLLAAHQAQYAAQQSSLAGVAPIREQGHVYEVSHLDPNQALDMVDKASMKIFGRTLDEKDRQAYAQWLDETYTSRQQQVNAGHQSVDDANAQADAYAQSLVDPATGKVLNSNMVTAKARQYLGIPYVWGGKDPSTGLDCSGFVNAVYSGLGVRTLNGNVGEQWSNGGGVRFTDQNMAQPGDVVFFGNMNDPNHQHVGIYIGNGMMIDSPHTGARVQLDAVAGFSSSMGLVGFMHFNSLGGVQMAQGPNGAVASGQASTAFQGPTSNMVNEPGSGLYSHRAVGPDGQMSMVTNRSDSEQVVTDVAHRLAQQYGVDPNRLAQIAVATMHQESGGNAQAVGDNGTSFGLFQLHQGGELGNLTPEQAFDAETNATVAITVMAQVLKANPNASPGRIAAMAQRPADPTGYAASVDSAVNGGSLGATITGNNPDSSVPGPDGSKIETINGRTVVVTPDQTVNAIDPTGAGLNDALMAHIRASNPAMAGMQDMVSAYGMLTKTLRDGITVNNN